MHPVYRYPSFLPRAVYCLQILLYKLRNKKISKNVSRGIVALILVIVFGLTGRSHSEDTAKLPEIGGVWILDKTYTREYLIAGSKLQQLWCGYGWSDQEIERRRDKIMNLAFQPKMTIQKLSNNSYKKTMNTESGGVETTTLSNCTMQDGTRMQCDTGSTKFASKGYPDLDKAYLRRVDRYLFADIPVHKSLMQCPAGNVPPDDTEWISIRYVSGA